MIKLLIVGAGITGLALARRLTNTNVKVTILERDAQFSPAYAGICLPTNAVLQMKRLGLYDRLRKASQQIDHIYYQKVNGVPLVSASLLEPPFNKAECLSLPRQTLLDLLRYNMAKNVCFGSQVTKMTNSEAGVFVHINHSAKPEFFDLVAACDGLQSTTRQLAFKNAKPRSQGITSWRFIVNHAECDAQLTHFLGDDHSFMLVPLSPTSSYCYAQIADPLQQWRNLPPATSLLTLFSHYAPAVKTRLNAIGSHTRIVVNTLESISTSSSFELRTVLVGDALQGCPPHLLQGVGLGLEDINLLADLITRYPVDDALEIYNEERLPRAHWIASETLKQNDILIKSKAWPGRLIRNMLLRQQGPAEILAWQKLLKDKVDAGTDAEN